MDHHGSDAKKCNAGLHKCDGDITKVAIVMGPGLKHAHPATSVMHVLKEKNIKMVATHYHFDDFPDSDKNSFISRNNQQWGDIGVTIYQGNSYRINVSNGVIIYEDESNPFNVCDVFIDSLLCITRKINPSPLIVAPVKRGEPIEKVLAVCRYNYSGKCKGIVQELPDRSDGLMGGYACETHKNKCLKDQEYAPKVYRIPLKKRRINYHSKRY